MADPRRPKLIHAHEWDTQSPDDPELYRCSGCGAEAYVTKIPATETTPASINVYVVSPK